MASELVLSYWQFLGGDICDIATFSLLYIGPVKLASLLFLKHTEYVGASGTLHILFFLVRMLFS